VLLAVRVIAGSLGCDGESSFVIPPWDAGAVDTRHAAACAAWAQRVCDYEDRCPPAISARATSRAQCVDRAALTCEVVGEDPNSAFDEAVVAGCEYPTDCTAQLPPFMCLAPGRAAEGAACLFVSDCSASDYCGYRIDLTTGQDSVCGKCTHKITCSPACASDQACLPGDGGTSCIHIPAAGETCDATEDHLCRRAFCVGALDGGTGVCRGFSQRGEPCGTGIDGPFCIADTYCDDTLHCAGLTPAGYGAPCGINDAGVFNRCTGYGQCDYASTGLCVPPAPDGALCDPTQGLRCLPPAVCYAHHCVYPTMAYCSGG
jgi:hypothetical protein